jgi:predicted enzyme related to lactoylglutathione lyase
MKIRAIILFVRDIERVALFYEKHFGLKRVGKIKDGYLELGKSGTRIALHVARGSDGDNSHSPAKIVFSCRNVKKKVAELTQAGLKFKKIYEYEGFCFADTQDPEKNPVQISERSSRS